jgi:glycosyltransferase involved in cell wall biosynthesis
VEKMIDVFIPTKNSSETIQRTLFSILDSGIPINRIIVVDASSDETVRIITSWCAYHQIKLLIQKQFEEKTLGNAREIGLNLVETDIYASIDSDVILTKGWYKWLAKLIEFDAVAIASGFLYFGTRGTLLYRFMEWKRENRVFNITLGNCLIKKSHIIELGGFEQKLGSTEDTVLYSRMCGDGRYKWLVYDDAIAYNPRDWVTDLKALIWYGEYYNDGFFRMFMRLGGGFFYGLRMSSISKKFLIYLPFRMTVWFFGVWWGKLKHLR